MWSSIWNCSTSSFLHSTRCVCRPTRSSNTNTGIDSFCHRFSTPTIGICTTTWSRSASKVARWRDVLVPNTFSFFCLYSLSVAIAPMWPFSSALRTSCKPSPFSAIVLLASLVCLIKWIFSYTAFQLISYYDWRSHFRAQSADNALFAKWHGVHDGLHSDSVQVRLLARIASHFISHTERLVRRPFGRNSCRFAVCVWTFEVHCQIDGVQHFIPLHVVLHDNNYQILIYLFIYGKCLIWFVILFSFYLYYLNDKCWLNDALMNESQIWALTIRKCS